jgi:hypothetical protein
MHVRPVFNIKSFHLGLNLAPKGGQGKNVLMGLTRHAMLPSQNVEQLALAASAYMLFIILTVYSNCSPFY